MLAPPAWQLAAWPEPNYVDPVTRGNAKIILNLVLYPIVLMLILLRVYTRVFHLKVNTFSIDDTMILLAMIPTTVFFIFSLLADLHFLWRRHVYDIPLSNIETGLKLVLVTEFMFALACTLTKLSMLFLIRRVLATATLLWRRITLGAIWIVAIQGTVFEFAIIFQCRPPQDYWNVVYQPQPQCINQTALLLVAGVINTLTDFMVVLLPIRTVLSLELPKRQTWIIIVLFALGFLSSVAGVVRTYYTYEVTIGFDSTWNSFPVWITAAAELYIGLICASIPATKPFFSTYIPRLFAATTHYTNRSRNHVSHHRLSDLQQHQIKSGHLSAISALSHSTTASPTPRRSRLLTLSPLTFHRPNTNVLPPQSPSSLSPSSSTTTKIGSRTVSAVGSKRITSMRTVNESIHEEEDMHKGDAEMEIGFSSHASEENEAMRKEMEDEFLFQYGNVYSPSTGTPRHIHHHSRRHSQSRNSQDITDTTSYNFPFANTSQRSVPLPDSGEEEEEDEASNIELSDFVFLNGQNPQSRSSHSSSHSQSIPHSPHSEIYEGDMVIQDLNANRIRAREVSRHNINNQSIDIRRSWGSWDDGEIRGRERERCEGEGDYRVRGYGFGAPERLQIRGQELWGRGLSSRRESVVGEGSFKDFDLELGFP